jgi:hypothetical protein
MRGRFAPTVPGQRRILLTAVLAGLLGTGLHAALVRRIDLWWDNDAALVNGTIAGLLLGLWFGREPALIAFGLLWAPAAALLVVMADLLLAGGSFSRNYMFGGFLVGTVWLLCVVGLWCGFVAWVGVRVRRALRPCVHRDRA